MLTYLLLKGIIKMTKKKKTKSVTKKAILKKKSFTDIKPVKILNKKNALEFADYLYSEKSDGKKQFCSYVKMCQGSLTDSAKKNPLSCILGEAYIYFINSKLSETELQKEVDRHFDEINEHNNDLMNDYYYNKNSTYPKSICVNYSDEEELVSFILTKNSTCKKEKLSYLKNALNSLPRINDDSDCYDGNEYEIRAKNVKDVWMKIVVPLLK